MSPLLIGVIGLACLFILMFAGMPIALTMMLVGFAGYAVITGPDAAMNMVAMSPYSSVASYIFSVLPLFLFMGEFASVSGLMRDAYQTMHKWIGHMPGGLAMASIGGCAGFAAACGCSFATAATTTRVALPEMLEYKYDPKLAVGSLAAGGTLGILIPPSLVLIVYGIIAEQSVGRLFMAGVLPGILLALMFMVTIYITAKRNPEMGPPGPRASWRERLVAIKGVWGVLTLFLLVMGGIWGGVFTPTEAGAIGAFVAVLFTIGRRQLNRQNLSSAFMNMVRTSGMVYCVLIGAFIFTYFMAVSGLPRELASIVAGLPIPPIGILAIILFGYIILGCIMDTLAMTLITLPIYLPLLSALGIDLIWFGILMTIITEMALITPPIGMNVFVIAGMVRDIPMYTIFRGVLPFVVTMTVCLIILVAFPQISLFLPNTMMAIR